MNIHIAAAAGDVDLASGWTTLWGSISSSVGPQVHGLLTIIGVILLVFALGKYIFDKRRGGGATQGLSAVLWTLLAGALLASPDLIIPAALTILDLIINGLVHIVTDASPGH